MADTTGTPSQLILSRSTLDRDSLRRTVPGLLPDLLADPSTKVLHLRGERMPVQEIDGVVGLRFRAPAPGDDDARCAYLGRQADQSFVAVFGDAEEEPKDAGTTDPRDLQRQRARSHRSLRSLAPVLRVDELGIATTAAAMANWLAVTHFCVRCGAAVRLDQAGWVLVCPDGHHQFPRTDAAVIMSVIDPADRLLLAQGTRFVLPTGMSVLAGFLEPGESMEAAVAREVLEEVGVIVDRAQYVDNQPWPMPASLMIGYEAHTSQTRLHLDPKEIRKASWFTRDELNSALASGEVTIPPSLSIARHLIERWYGSELPPQPGDVQ